MRRSRKPFRGLSLRRGFESLPLRFRPKKSPARRDFGHHLPPPDGEPLVRPIRRVTGFARSGAEITVARTVARLSLTISHEAAARACFCAGHELMVSAHGRGPFFAHASYGAPDPARRRIGPDRPSPCEAPEPCLVARHRRPAQEALLFPGRRGVLLPAVLPKPRPGRHATERVVFGSGTTHARPRGRAHRHRKLLRGLKE